eukprot:Phypoly_transcript_00502.p1 GENE.Phypoly_transcript_00502~~Phypoly_transcript_00502.p1  ORF type:complete len:1390 (-),score=279.22 Phypoly_transcript_00502:293-4462(-)
MMLETFLELQVSEDHLLQILANTSKPAKEEGEWTPLHYACAVGTLEMVNHLLNVKRVPPDPKSMRKNTPFQVACARGHADIAMLFLKRGGVNVKQEDRNGWSVIHYACHGGNPEIVKEIVRRGANVKAKSKVGWTPLHCAARGGHVEVANIILAKKEATKLVFARDQIKNTPLHYACLSGHLRMSEVLIAKGASVTDANDLKQSPLHLACANGNLQLIQYLIARGAEVNCRDDEKRAPLHYSAEKGQVDIALTLLSHGADINILDKMDWTPLHYAANFGLVNMSIMLLSKGADFCAKDKKGSIPLGLSCHNQLDTYHREFIFGNLPMDPNFGTLAYDRLNQIAKLNKTTDFSKCGLQGFPPGLAFASNVRDLDLSHNHIVVFPTNMPSFVHLRKLSLAHNNLHMIPDPIFSLPSLITLDVSYNLLSDLPPTILQFKTLSELNLEHNRFLMLPSFLASMANLVEVALEGNPLTCIPPQIKGKGYKDIAVYLKQLQDGCAIWGRMKLMLVGQEGVGKTSLLQCIQKKAKSEVTQLLSTDGIEISSFVSNKVQFRSWDFGGQLVFYPTHQFFLTRGCVYLVMFDLSKPSTLDRVDYWLQQLRVLAFEDPRAITAIIIGTHAEKEGASTVEIAARRFPPQRFPFVRAFMQVTCKARKQVGVNTVVDKLIELSKDDKTFSSFVPESYINLESRLVQLVSTGVDYVEWASYFEICRSCNIKAEDVEFVTRFMHDAGVLIHFEGLQPKSVFWESNQKTRQAGGVVILNPQWLANVMASIITFSHKWVKHGILLHSDLAQIWKEKYHPDLWNLLLSLLEEFEVLYPLQGNAVGNPVMNYLVPSLLPSMPPPTQPTPPCVEQFESIWRMNPTCKLRRVYSWETLPMGFFPRLLIRIAHLGKWSTPGWWVDGVMIAHGPHMAFVRFIEGNTDGASVAPLGNFHLEIRVATKSNLDSEVPLAPMLAQLSHSICALRDTAYHQYRCFSIIYCSYCLAKNLARPHIFTYAECMDSVLTDKTLTCATCNAKVTLDLIAPDIAFANVPRITEGLEIGEIIGQGGFGKVYKGFLTDAEGKKEVAIKEAIGVINEEDFQMLQHEVFLMSAIKHPNLVLFYGIAQQPNMQIVMEFVPGEDLSKVLYSNSLNNITPPLEWQLRVAYDIACAMQYLHGLHPPITHRDLRSPNVLVMSNNAESAVTAKVIDLGLAQQLVPNTYGGLETWQWMAPETIMPTLKTAYTEKCDVYSFGIVVWEIVAQGKLPFQEFASEQVMLVKERIARQGLRPQIPTTCPEDLARLIADCWQGDPKLRPAFNQIIFALEHMLLARHVNLTESHASAQKYAALRSSAQQGPAREMKTAPSAKIEKFEDEPGAGASTVERFPNSKVFRSHSMAPTFNNNLVAHP